MTETNCDVYYQKRSKNLIYSLNNGYIARLKLNGEIIDKDIHKTLKEIDHGMVIVFHHFISIMMLIVQNLLIKQKGKN